MATIGAPGHAEKGASMSLYLGVFVCAFIVVFGESMGHPKLLKTPSLAQKQKRESAIVSMLSSSV